MEDECATSITRIYDLWFYDKGRTYMGNLWCWGFAIPTLFFESDDTQYRFKKLVPASDFIYMSERCKDKEPNKVSLATFLEKFPIRAERNGLPRISFHKSIDDVLNAATR